MEDLEDVEIINDLLEGGPAHIDALYNSIDLDDEDNKKKFSKYELLFLTQSDIFNDNIKLYIDYLLENNDNCLWGIMTNYVEEKELYDIILKITHQMIKNTLDDQIFILKKIFLSEKIQSLLKESYNLWDLTLGILFNTLQINEKWNDEIVKIQLFVKEYIRDKSMRNTMIEWIETILNLCVKKIHLDISDNQTNLPSDYYLANILGFLIAFWKDGSNNERIIKIDYDYIIISKIKL